MVKAARGVMLLQCSFHCAFIDKNGYTTSCSSSLYAVYGVSVDSVQVMD